MGGQQSSRKLTISNNDPTNVIKVSDSVVQRFKGEQAAGSSPDQQQPQGAVGEVVPITSAPMVPSYKPPPIPSPYPYPHPFEPGLTSLQIRQEKEAELRANDLHWQKRINQLEETHEKINTLMEEEYHTAMNEVKGNFIDTKGHIRDPICLEGKRAVMKCYKDHPKEPMKCAQEVQAFADCVDKHRSAIVANRG